MGTDPVQSGRVPIQIENLNVLTNNHTYGYR